jgi:hypothetical protein
MTVFIALLKGFFKKKHKENLQELGRYGFEKQDRGQAHHW